MADEEAGEAPITDSEQGQDSGDDLGHSDDDAGQAEPQKAVDWERDYKHLQSDHTKKSQALSGFDDFGGADNAKQILQAVIENDDVLAILNGQGGEPSTPENEFDDDTQAALRMVDDRIRAATERQIAPLIKEQMQRKLDSVLSEMDGLHKGWRDLKGEMAEVVNEQVRSGIPDAHFENASIQMLEGIYYQALAKSGKMEDYATGIYKQKLQASKSRSSDRPVGSPSLSPAKPMTTAEALQAAKKKFGRTELPVI